jgi:hypothetical protein
MGPATRFPGKTRVPFPLALTPQLHEILQRTSTRLGIRRGDVICELLTQYADQLKLGHDITVTLIAYDQKRKAVRLTPSLGIAWGEAGRAWLAVELLTRALVGGGTALAPISEPQISEVAAKPPRPNRRVPIFDRVELGLSGQEAAERVVKTLMCASRELRPLGTLEEVLGTLKAGTPVVLTGNLPFMMTDVPADGYLLGTEME